MSGGPIRIEITGPEGSGVSKLASKWTTTLQLDGKVVRLYDETMKHGAIPDPLPTDCHVLILVRKP